jgi:hypothetical protein
MKRHLGTRDRLAWLVAVLAIGAVLYFFLPLWVLVGAVVVAVGVPLLVRTKRRQATRR